MVPGRRARDAKSGLRDGLTLDHHAERDGYYPGTIARSVIATFLLQCAISRDLSIAAATPSRYPVADDRSFATPDGH